MAGFPLRKSKMSLNKAKTLARKKVDKIQNAVVEKLSKRVKKLELGTVERKYLQSFDTFQIGGGGVVKSRALHRYGQGIYDGMDTFYAFGTTAPEGDRVYARYMIVEIALQVQPESLVESPEHNPTKYQIWLLKPRKEVDYGTNKTATNGLDNQSLITLNTPGLSFVNPKAFKVLKSARGMLGAFGSQTNPGYGKAFARYRFKVPINRWVNLQQPDETDNKNVYPTEIQDQIFLAISSNGSSVDLEQPSCTVSTLLCYDDAGDN